MKQKRKFRPTLATYIDLSKAYDTVSHQKLLRKLRNDFSFSPSTVAFFQSYFTNRTQQLYTSHATSAAQPITHGIPQGSTLSTTLFLLYINDIIHAIREGSVYTFADDTTLIITADTMEALETLAQSELSSIISYFHLNNLVPNPTKTQYTIFSQPKNATPIHLTIQDTALKETTSAKLLGVILTPKLKFSNHVRLIIKKLQPTIRSFRYANKLLPTQTMRQLYYAHIYPHLIGSITIWGSSNPRAHYLQPLIRTHKRILRLLINAPPHAHTRPILSNLRLLDIPHLYILRVSSEMHPFIFPKRQLNRPKHHHQYLPSSHIHNYPTRHARSGRLYIPAHVNYNSGNRTFEATHFQGLYSRIWSELPAEIRGTPNLEQFKDSLKEHLLKKQSEANV